MWWRSKDQSFEFVAWCHMLLHTNDDTRLTWSRKCSVTRRRCWLRSRPRLLSVVLNANSDHLLKISPHPYSPVVPTHGRSGIQTTWALEWGKLIMSFLHPPKWWCENVCPRFFFFFFGHFLSHLKVSCSKCISLNKAPELCVAIPFKPNVNICSRPFDRFAHSQRERTFRYWGHILCDGFSSVMISTDKILSERSTCSLRQYILSPEKKVSHFLPPCNKACEHFGFHSCVHLYNFIQYTHTFTSGIVEPRKHSFDSSTHFLFLQDRGQWQHTCW